MAGGSLGDPGGRNEEGRGLRKGEKRLIAMPRAVDGTCATWCAIERRNQDGY